MPKKTHRPGQMVRLPDDLHAQLDQLVETVWEKFGLRCTKAGLVEAAVLEKIDRMTRAVKEGRLEP